MTSDTDLEAELVAAERRLQAAMLAGDVDALDGLLDDRLVATLAPSADLVSKAADLDSHRSRRLRLTSLDEQDLVHLVTGTTGVTRLVAALTGTSEGTPFEVRMVYTRAWAHDASGWRVVAAHISPG